MLCVRTKSRQCTSGLSYPQHDPHLSTSHISSVNSCASASAMNSPEKILMKIHRTRKLLEMESRIAVAVSVLPWM